MADDGCPAQSFQNPDLDFLRMEGDQTVEARAEAFNRLARQADDQIGMDVNGGPAPQEMKVVGELLVVLPPADQSADLRIKRLNADLAASWKPF